MQEIWKDIEGYEDLYQVSNLGRVRSFNKYVVLRNGELKKLNDKILKPRSDKKLYPRYSLYKNKSSKSFKAHRLVAIHFIPNPENKLEVNHIDGNKKNNHCINLEWVTASENQKHAYKNKLRIPKFGMDHPMSTFKDDDVFSIRYKYSNKYTLKKLSMEYNVSITTISNIVRKKVWKHI